jgi:uncharacterized cupin superfamily protein
MDTFKIISCDAPQMPLAAPLPSDQILVGSPAMLCDVRSDNGLTHTGFWSSTAGTFKWLYAYDEIIHILEGEAYLSVPPRSPGDQPPPMQRIGQGDCVHFPSGSQALWMVPKYLRKFYVIVDQKPPSFAARLRRRFKGHS